MRTFIVPSIIAILFLSPLYLFFASKTSERDSTDQPSGKRSGFALMTDYGTGCEYLYRNGGITPRFDKNGKQLGCK